MPIGTQTMAHTTLVGHRNIQSAVSVIPMCEPKQFQETRCSDLWLTRALLKKLYLSQVSFDELVKIVSRENN